jgi:hypothetical protein
MWVPPIIENGGDVRIASSWILVERLEVRYNIRSKQLSMHFWFWANESDRTKSSPLVILSSSTGSPDVEFLKQVDICVGWRWLASSNDVVGIVGEVWMSEILKTETWFLAVNDSFPLQKVHVEYSAQNAQHLLWRRQSDALRNQHHWSNRDK